MSSANKRTLLLVVWMAVLCGLFVAITHISSLPGAPSIPGHTPPPKKLSVSNVQRHWPDILAHAAAPPHGAANAPYTLAEFGDFQCPQCGRMRPVIESLVARSKGQANLIFCMRPIPSIHPYAEAAAQAALAAAAQGKFWPMYDELYSNQDNLEPGFYGDYAKAVGLNVPQFLAAMKSSQYKAAEKADMTFDDSIGMQVTPTLVVHNNKTGEIKIYIGSDSTKPDAVVGYQGIVQLAAAPPWAAGAH